MGKIGEDKMAKNISVRVPWHDNGWNGEVCNKPQANNACKVLKNIAQRRQDDNGCEEHCGKSQKAWDKNFIPPCIRESGFFLSTSSHHIIAKHPYSFKESFAHILPTKIDIEENSFIGIPYGWFLKEDKDQFARHQIYFTAYNEDIEPKDYDYSFISNGINQKNILEYFWKDIKPKESLVVAYAKAVPFSESYGRVIVAISPIKQLSTLKEYDYSTKPDGITKYKAMTWERIIHHQLVGKNNAGFIIPFKQIMNYIKRNPETDIDDLLLFAPEEYRYEFSYGCEHISPDAMIITLNRALKLLGIYRKLNFKPENDISWGKQIEWCKQQLDTAWRQRGPYPGLGAVLNALGLKYAYDVVEALRKRYPGPEIWEQLGEIFVSKKSVASILPEHLGQISKEISKSQLENIKFELENNADFLKLLARMNLNPSQAEILLNAKDRDDDEIKLLKRLCPMLKWEDGKLEEEAVKNPYILYEQTRLAPQDFVIALDLIDLAFFPPEPYKNEWINEDEQIDANDKRRIRALATKFLENEAEKGSTFASRERVIEFCNNFRPDMPGVMSEDINIKNKIFDRYKDFFSVMFISGQIKLRTLEDEECRTIYKLSRLEKIDELIKKSVEERLSRKKQSIDEDWNAILMKIFGDESDQKKKDSRREKLDAIQKMAESSISVLTGGAGTGKTSALRALCHNQKIQDGKILILTPTGKARVVLSSALHGDGIKHESNTVFAFLKSQQKCDDFSYRYYIGSYPPQRDIARTVIIDESSMLTEEMMGALLQSLEYADRIIFAGDPNQLPPIGAGKPFFELCKKLENEKTMSHFACLTINNRQEGLGAEVGALFKTDNKNHDPTFISKIMQKTDKSFMIMQCEKSEYVPDKIRQALDEVFNDMHLEGENLVKFDFSLGGEINKIYMNFNKPQKVENWQILSPWKNREYYGSLALNKLIHDEYGEPLERGNGIRKRKTLLKLGKNAICYGEKVICLHNRKWSKKKKDIYALNGYNIEDCRSYTANGEIGIVANLWGEKWNPMTRKIENTHHEVHFASQEGFLYKYESGISNDETEENLELAYALSIHKAQGSGFDYTILLLIDEGERPSAFLSREMIYTALTRQQKKLIIITNLDFSEILEYAKNSELQKRLTNLFGNTFFEEEGKGWFDDRLIHHAIDGTRLRSKSELVIYNMLLEAGIKPLYEKEIKWDDGKVLPDFTIIGKNGPIYWEHLGMLDNSWYAQHWQEKKKLYANHGISEERKNLLLSMDEPITHSLDARKITKIINTLKSRL